MLNAVLNFFVEYQTVFYWTLAYLAFSFAAAILIGRFIKAGHGDYND